MIKEILYLEVPTSDQAAVLSWLQGKFNPAIGEKYLTPDGCRWKISDHTNESIQLSIFLWSVQRTTYLKGNK